MNDNIISKYNNEAYQCLNQARNSYQQYLQRKQSLYLLNNQILFSQQGASAPIDVAFTNSLQLLNRRFQEELYLNQFVETVANQTTVATLNALFALQLSVGILDRFSAILQDNILASICSFIELAGIGTDIHMAYKRYCRIGNVNKMLSDIINNSRRLSYQLSGIERLRSIIG